MNSRGIVFLLFGLLITIAVGLVSINRMAKSSPQSQDLTTALPVVNPFDEIATNDSPVPYQNPFDETSTMSEPYKNPFE